MAGIPLAGPHPGSAELPQSRQARPEEVQAPSRGAAEAVTLSMLADVENEFINMKARSTPYLVRMYSV